MAVIKRQISYFPNVFPVAVIFAGSFYSAVLLGLSALIFYGLIVISGTFAFFLFFTFSFPEKRRCFLVAVAAGFFLGAFSAVMYYRASVPLKTLIQEKDIVFLSGQVAGNPVRIKGGNYRVPFRTQKAASEAFSASAPGVIQLFMPASYVEAHYPGKLYSVSGDKTAALVEKGLYMDCEVMQSTLEGFYTVTSIKNAQWLPGLLQLRASFRLQLKRLLFSWGASGGLLLALLSGSREYIDPLVSEGFKNAGLAHILALSGMHLSFFGTIALVFGTFIGGKRLSLFFSLSFMTLFVWFAGDSPSLVRSLFCGIFLGVGKALYLEVSVLKALCASFVLQTLLFPFMALEISFLLSYGALFGIITIGEGLRKKSLSLIPPIYAGPLCASLGAQLCTAPFSAVFFSSLMPVGIVASAAVSPLATVFLGAGFFMVVLCLIFPPLIGPSGFLMNFLYEAVKIPVLFFARFPPVSF